MNQENTLSSFLKAIQENESLIKGFASSKCKDCIGRGVVEITAPRGKAHDYLCSCVVKNAKKEFKDN